jgi:hypothetical protein
MTVTLAQFGALQAALAADGETFERHAAAVDFLDGEGFSILLATAFVTAARRYFPAGWSRGDVVRFVGHFRARNRGAIEHLSVSAAEQMLLSALSGKPMTRHFDENTKSIAQFALLAELVRDFSEQEVSVFLAEVRGQADTWLMQRSNQ